MTGTFAISSSMQDYLEAILNLSEKDDGLARITDIANMLSIAKASVSQAISSLKDLGLVAQERYGPVELTCAGRELAIKVRHRHRTLRKFLVEVLGVDPKIAEKDACLMEHVVSQQTLEKFMEFLETTGKPEGAAGAGISSGAGAMKNPIWDEGKEAKILRSVNTRALSELQTGEKGKVLRTTAKGPVHRRILEMGVTPGAEIFVKGVAPLGDPIEVLVRGYHLSLRKEEAATIFVEVV
ncbi:Transcriptional regulator MntR [Pelotomaculum sp. FP]|uniref:metal-dependent transcriptional regulator n=1 Tax=Pelotomaculum sp. FP TaxID=261474 RepID=UPI001066FB51|nr:DtxR family transcriptional regulator [Pelotomaculum sp. FP]TEB16727.1 Transcriptional regulator MntR [Pelotomaculum sp. FP]